MQPRPLILVGAGLNGQAGVVLDLVRHDPCWEPIGFLDGRPDLAGTRVDGLPVLGSTDDIESLELPDADFHVSIGDNAARGALFHRLESIGREVVTLIHPTAIVSERATIGRGCYVGPGAIVNAGAIVGNAVLINSGVILEHDARVGDAVHLAPGTATGGRVTIEQQAFVGIGSVVLPDVTIGEGVFVGAGSTVVRSVEPNVTVMGYAARKRNIYEARRPDVDRLQVTRPSLPDHASFEPAFDQIHASGMVSNFAHYNRELEREIELRLSVDHALTFPNATSALMLVLRVLGLSGEVLVPSFTFAATGHAALWNELTPIFVDIDPHTLTIDCDDLERKITDRTSAILAVHTFGNPCDTTRLASIAARHDLRLVYDAAHALGSLVGERAVGSFGDAEIFSLSGTKVVTCGEGALLTSRDEALIAELRRGRNYGAGADYDCTLLGLNGKMSEYHAAIALESLRSLERFIAARNEVALRYRERLGPIPGLRFQELPEGHRSTYKDMALLIDAEAFGVDRDTLLGRLNERGIYPKRYFDPPLHRMRLYRERELAGEGLPVTERVASQVLSLPIYSHMEPEAIERVCDAIREARPTANLVAVR